MSIFEPRFIQLTTLGSATVRVAATPGVIDDSALCLWVECDHSVWNQKTHTRDPQRTAYALSGELVEQINGAMNAEAG